MDIQTTKTIQMKDYGKASDVFFETEKDIPELKPTQILVEVKAAGIEPYDVKFRSGFFGTTDQADGTVLGSSIAGVVVAVGSETNFEVGQRVAASPHFKGYANYAVIAARQAATIPNEVTFEQAASLSLSAQTAYQGLVEELHFHSGDKIFVEGGTGAVGLLGAQIANALGASEVAITVGDDNVDPKIKELVGDQTKIINYKTTDDYSTIIQNYDYALNVVGSKTILKMAKVLKDGGTIITVNDVTSEQQEELKKRGVDAHHYYLTSNGEQLSKVLKLAEEKKIKPIIGQTIPFSLEGVIKAHELFESNDIQGKIVLTF